MWRKDFIWGIVLNVDAIDAYIADKNRRRPKGKPKFTMAEFARRIGRSPAWLSKARKKPIPPGNFTIANILRLGLEFEEAFKILPLVEVPQSNSHNFKEHEPVIIYISKTTNNPSDNFKKYYHEKEYRPYSPAAAFRALDNDEAIDIDRAV